MTVGKSGSCRRWIIRSYQHWYDYSRARDDMFQATDTSWAPWFVVRSDDKKRARLNVISHLLSQIPYEQAPREKVEAAEEAKTARLCGAGLSVQVRARADMANGLSGQWVALASSMSCRATPWRLWPPVGFTVPALARAHPRLAGPLRCERLISHRASSTSQATRPSKESAPVVEIIATVHLDARLRGVGCSVG